MTKLKVVAIGKLWYASFPPSLSLLKWWRVKLYVCFLATQISMLTALWLVMGSREHTGKGIYLEAYNKMIKSSSLSSIFLSLLWQLHLEMWYQGMSHLGGKANWQLYLGCWHWDLHFSFSSKKLLSSLCQPLPSLYWRIEISFFPGFRLTSPLGGQCILISLTLLLLSLIKSTPLQRRNTLKY